MVVSKERNNPLVKIFLAMFSEISLSVSFFFFCGIPLLRMIILNSMTFQVFYDPFKPCLCQWLSWYGSKHE